MSGPELLGYSDHKKNIYTRTTDLLPVTFIPKIYFPLIESRQESKAEIKMPLLKVHCDKFKLFIRTKSKVTEPLNLFNLSIYFGYLNHKKEIEYSKDILKFQVKNVFIHDNIIVYDLPFPSLSLYLLYENNITINLREISEDCESIYLLMDCTKPCKEVVENPDFVNRNLDYRIKNALNGKWDMTFVTHDHNHFQSFNNLSIILEGKDVKLEKLKILNTTRSGRNRIVNEVYTTNYIRMLYEGRIDSNVYHITKNNEFGLGYFQSGYEIIIKTNKCNEKMYENNENNLDIIPPKFYYNEILYFTIKDGYIKFI